MSAASSRVVFLYEASELDDGELNAVQTETEWRATSSMLDVCAGDLVIARHYAWPWPERLDADLARLGARALNDARAYRYAASAMRWSDDLGDLTPRTWEDFSKLPDGMSFVLKGEKADKGNWSRMFAADKHAAIALRRELWRDTGMRGHTIVAREFVPLERLGDGFGAAPISTEFRVFVCDGAVLSRGFYWPPGDCERAPPSDDVIPAEFLSLAIARVSPHVRYFTLDVARGADGQWWVIEVSDGQRAGLSENSPRGLYAALAKCLETSVI